jgi:demethylmenaquinone methyltransferase/2-methoxy-6-polyprenyl-1,4-benzoquinol methylase
LYSFWQYQRWQRFLVSRLGDLNGKVVLDMSTGTGLVAAHITQRWKAQVVGVDVSPRMLREAQQSLSQKGMVGDISLVLGRAESPPFAQGAFDAVIFTYLLRYVEDVPSVISQLAGLVKPGGAMASLEFAVPRPIWFKAPWLAYTHLAMPISMRLISPSWSRVGRFLGPSIRRLYRQYPQEQQLALWRQSGIRDVKAKSLSLGAALVTWGTKGPTT